MDHPFLEFTGAFRAVVHHNFRPNVNLDSRNLVCHLLVIVTVVIRFAVQVRFSPLPNHLIQLVLENPLATTKHLLLLRGATFNVSELHHTAICIDCVSRSAPCTGAPKFTQPQKQTCKAC
jgi:hypothetical protein